MDPTSPYAVDFTIDVERETRLIAVRVTGVPSPEDVGWIAEEVRAAILTLGADAGRHRTLYDARGVHVLPQATADFVLKNFTDIEGTQWAHRLAFVASTMLTRLQVRRIVEVRPGAMLFDDVEAARAWLLGSG
ncbi:hypothetical protein CA233_16945 [Sphingomonas sp. ABOLD]|uniref:SpoIIAA-like protein n=1 Tax=Sphingomonas trueperi TaxID=53317 RepID=A0A7X5XVD0_9SPHN|nr:MULTISPECIES: hypothetical protein [Sphingomonas]NJB96039.1 hypothetical protein [Sphingomonas trueperi]RSV42744.1 hypothetical protein CA233_16945 [Sphingomonas sp. ABOLD]